MRRIILTLAAAVLVALFSSASSQAFDFEVGHQLSNQGRSVYVLTRADLHLGAPILGADPWLLPEVGVFYHYNEPLAVPDGYARLQLTLDAPAATLFVDGKINTAGSWRVRTGVRFGVNIGP